MVYRAAPVTQRDGSKLANSNCRMASIATGLDYHTLGAKKSTGAKMRSYTSDQAGGTASDDARESWVKGYDQALRIMDGNPWSSVIKDLEAGRLVHLDVWHGTCGGPCLSGSGAYGHTMAVAPEKNGTKWLVADPWCSPAKWVWWEESKLRAGAERWGNEVFGRATSGPDWPVGADPRSLIALLVVWRVARALMDRWYPGNERETDDDPPDTGGASMVLYTTTKPQGTVSGGTDVGIYYNVSRWADPGVDLYLDAACTQKVTSTTPGGYLTTIGPKAAQDANGMDATAYAVMVSTSKLVDGGAVNTRAFLWAKRDSLPDATEPTSADWDESVWALLGDPNGRYPGSTPTPEPPPDNSGEIEAAVKARDAAWETALKTGNKWPTTK